MRASTEWKQGGGGRAFIAARRWKEGLGCEWYAAGWSGWSHRRIIALIAPRNAGCEAGIDDETW